MDYHIFYRGQSDKSFELIPSIYREKLLIQNENRIFRDIIAQSPADFKGCTSTFEKLVKKDDEQDEESQQTSAEDEEVLCLQALELYRTADTLVDWVFSHTLFIKGRMSAGWWRQQSGRCTRRTTRRLSCWCRGRPMKTCRTLLRPR